MADQQNTEREFGQFIGEVKWFNNKRGYGFLKVVSEDRKGEDIFVHQTNGNIHTILYRIFFVLF